RDGAVPRRNREGGRPYYEFVRLAPVRPDDRARLREARGPAAGRGAARLGRRPGSQSLRAAYPNRGVTRRGIDAPGAEPRGVEPAVRRGGGTANRRRAHLDSTVDAASAGAAGKDVPPRAPAVRLRTGRTVRTRGLRGARGVPGRVRGAFRVLVAAGRALSADAGGERMAPRAAPHSPGGGGTPSAGAVG